MRHRNCSICDLRPACHRLKIPDISNDDIKLNRNFCSIFQSKVEIQKIKLLREQIIMLKRRNHTLYKYAGQ